MPVTRSAFGRLQDGRAVDRIVLTHPSGVAVEVLEYGATIHSIRVPDKHGRAIETVLSYPSLRDYEVGKVYLGATIGRCAGRTAVTEQGRWPLTRNEGSNHLHGGKTGFSHSVWRVVEIDEGDEPRVLLRHHSAAGEDGYPGNLVVDAEFALTAPLTLRVFIRASSDRATPVNMTLHPYFNLNGDASSTVDNHELHIAAESILPLGAMHLPTGERLSVAATPFDFRGAMPIGARLDDAHEQLRITGGYDHYWVLNADTPVAADVFSPASALGLRVGTNQAGVQFYAGNQLHADIASPFPARAGLCIEPHAFPNAMNERRFPDIILRPGEIYEHQTSYAFYTR